MESQPDHVMQSDPHFVSIDSIDEAKPTPEKTKQNDEIVEENDEEEIKAPESYKSGGAFSSLQLANSVFAPDDPQGKTTYFYSYKVADKMFIVPRKYEIQKVVGKGSFGIVWKARNTETDELVAIKKLLNPFKIPGNIIRILREIRLMKFLDHENILQIKDLFPAVSIKNFESIYIWSEFVSTDLMQIIHSDNSLSDEHFKLILWQILSALKYIHSANIIHRDLKPSNILINEEWEIKICDFGMARAISQNDAANPINFRNPDLTQYVTTRIYRAPELLFVSSSEYNTKIDVWSVGWIFAEMLIRRPLFMTKNIHKHALMIYNLVGTEDDLKIPAYTKVSEYIKSNMSCFNEEGTLDKVFEAHSPQAKDLLKKLLCMNPENRISIDDALRHPYFEDYEDQLEDLEDWTKTFDNSFENNTDNLKNEILKEILSFNPNISKEQFAKHNIEYQFLRRSRKVHSLINN